jgi:molecular chaperone DnaJ
MPGQAQDPYAVLGVDRDVSDTELRAAYRQLVKRHHPDHNGGSEESERRFEEVQDAYARVRELRVGGASAGGASAGGASAGGPAGPRGGGGSGTRPGGSAGVDARIAEMERELREAKKARERAERARDEAVRAAREAAAAAAAAAASGDARGRRDGDRGRASDEELGYISTEDSFSKILSDARDAIAGRVDGARESPAVKRVEDLIDELADKLKGPPHDP